MTAKRTTPQFPTSSRDLPATQGMLQLVRSELKADIREFRSEMKAEFKQVESRFGQTDSRFSQTDAKVERVLEAVHHVASEVARVGILVEEQNSRNRIVLEGLTGLAPRPDRAESRVTEVEKLVHSIARPKT